MLWAIWRAQTLNAVSGAFQQTLHPGKSGDFRKQRPLYESRISNICTVTLGAGTRTVRGAPGAPRASLSGASLVLEGTLSRRGLWTLVRTQAINATLEPRSAVSATVRVFAPRDFGDCARGGETLAYRAPAARVYFFFSFFFFK